MPRSTKQSARTMPTELPRKLVILDEALADLREIARYAASRAKNAERGAAFAKRLLDRSAAIARSTARLGRPRPEFGHDLRSAPHLGYLIFFRYSGDRVEVVAFIHGARDLAVAFAERQERYEP